MDCHSDLHAGRIGVLEPRKALIGAYTLDRVAAIRYPEPRLLWLVDRVHVGRQDLASEWLLVLIGQSIKLTPILKEFNCRILENCDGEEIFDGHF